MQAPVIVLAHQRGVEDEEAEDGGDEDNEHGDVDHPAGGDGGVGGLGARVDVALDGAFFAGGGGGRGGCGCDRGGGPGGFAAACTARIGCVARGGGWACAFEGYGAAWDGVGVVQPVVLVLVAPVILIRVVGVRHQPAFRGLCPASTVH